MQSDALHYVLDVERLSLPLMRGMIEMRQLLVMMALLNDLRLDQAVQ